MFFLVIHSVQVGVGMRTWCFNQDAETLDFVWAGRLHPGAASDYNAMYIEPMRKSASPISTWGEQVPPIRQCYCQAQALSRKGSMIENALVLSFFLLLFIY
jgi:hypothetical protein